MARIIFHCRGCIPPETARRNRDSASARGLPGLSPSTSPKLAVIGGGRSAVDFPADWDGDIWAINRTWQWLGRDDAWFFTIDPLPVIADYAKGAKAILATVCDPAVFDAVASAEVFDIGPGGYTNGPTSASSVPGPALTKGYRGIVFWGCESSWLETTHAYAEEDPLDVMEVSVAGKLYRTTPQWLLQAELLAEVIRAAPHVFREASGGLLRALVACPDYDVTRVSRYLDSTLKTVEAA